MLRDELTPRQWQIAQLVARGLRDAQIGKIIGISAFSVKQHMTKMYARIGLSVYKGSPRVMLAVRYAREYMQQTTELWARLEGKHGEPASRD